MEIKPLIIGLGCPGRLVLHFVELDLPNQMILVRLSVNDRWLQVNDFRFWLDREALKRFAEQINPWLRVRTNDAELGGAFVSMESSTFSLKLQTQGRVGDIEVVYALNTHDHLRIEAAGWFAFNTEFLLQLLDDVHQIMASFEQIWRDPALLAAYPHAYPLFEPFD